MRATKTKTAIRWLLMAAILALSPALAHAQCGATAGGVKTTDAGCGPQTTAIPSGTPTALTACNTSLAAGSYYVNANITSGAPGTTCFGASFPSGPIIIWGNGANYTVTGGIKITSNHASGSEIYGFNLTCGPTCISWTTTETPNTNSLLIHDNAINQQVADAGGIIVTYQPSSLGTPQYAIKIYNNSFPNWPAASNNNNRNTFIQWFGPRIAGEAYGNDIQAPSAAGNCEGIVAFESPGSYVHNNHIVLPDPNTMSGSSGCRGILFDNEGKFDSTGQGGSSVAAFNDIYAGQNRAVRVRAEISDTFHDNAVEDCNQGGTATGCIHVGDTDDAQQLAVTSVATGTGVYTGTFPQGGSNFYANHAFLIAGFSNAANNGQFTATASTTTTLTLSNASSVSESATATANVKEASDITVSANTLEEAGGNMVIASGNSLTTAQVHDNTVTCFSNSCTGAGWIARTGDGYVGWFPGPTVTISNTTLPGGALPGGWGTNNAVMACGPYPPGNSGYTCNDKTGPFINTSTVNYCSTGTVVGNGTITLNNTLPGCSGGGGGTSIVQLSPSVLGFATTAVGSSTASQDITLTNAGSGTMNITSIVATGDFSKTTTCGATLLTTASCTVSVTFTPAHKGTLTGAVTFTTDAASSPDVATPSGVGSVVALSGGASLTGGVVVP